MNILGIDFGTKNIGLAWCDTGIGVVLPFGVVKVKNMSKAIIELSDLAKEEKIQSIVIGLPLAMEDSAIENLNTKRVKEFGNNLKKLINIPIEFFDERLSSQAADRLVGLASRDEKSAMIILEDYISSNK